MFYGQYQVPSEYVIRNILIRVDPDNLDKALREWSVVYGQEDESLAIDGKVITADALLTQREFGPLIS